jgi:hypothetical protein
MPTFGLICSHCNDATDVVTPFNGKSLLASTSHGELIVALHNRCEGAWADKNDWRTLIPLRKIRHSNRFGAFTSSGADSERRRLNREIS